MGNKKSIGNGLWWTLAILVVACVAVMVLGLEKATGMLMAEFSFNNALTFVLVLGSCVSGGVFTAGCVHHLWRERQP